MSYNLHEIYNISNQIINRTTKNIIITGVTGQDGSHMVDYLLHLCRFKTPTFYTLEDLKPHLSV